jgi:hypothetical protein
VSYREDSVDHPRIAAARDRIFGGDYQLSGRGSRLLLRLTTNIALISN